MEQLLNAKPETPSGSGPFVRMSPAAWLIKKKLSRDFWIVFTAAFFFDFGISIFVFMFNLYLLELHFNDRWIGLVNSAAMLGTVVGTLPAGLLTRRVGLRPMLIFCLAAAPSLCALRALAIGESAQIGLGFVAGLVLSAWGVCFLPAVARCTTPDNRASGFSLIFSAGVGTGILGGVVCGFLPQWLSRAGFVVVPVDLKRLILLVSCGVAALGLLPILGTRLFSTDIETSRMDGAKSRIGARLLKLDPFLLRFLPVHCCRKFWYAFRPLLPARHKMHNFPRQLFGTPFQSTSTLLRQREPCTLSPSSSYQSRSFSLAAGPMCWLHRTSYRIGFFVWWDIPTWPC